MFKNVSSNKLILLFIAIWALLNALQGAFTELHPDEAYYWLYARFMDWGYFDHPPMVALFIRIGDSVFSHSAFALRFVTIVLNACGIFLLWKTLSVYGRNGLLFVLLFSGTLFFHVYAFVTTPDSPLFFFTACFFYLYQRYLKEVKPITVFCLMLVVACMLYSKYHAVLVFLFVIIGNLKVVLRPSFWLIIFGAACLFIPHVLWQLDHHLPSIQYHLFDRSSSSYHLSYSLDFLLGQLVLTSPLLGWFFYYSAYRLKSIDPFISSLKAVGFGFLMFFLFSTFKGRVEPHWTLVGVLALFMLCYIHLQASPKLPKWFYKVAYANVILILLIRMLFAFPLPFSSSIPVAKNFHGNKQQAHALRERAGDRYVLFLGSFQEASNYNFYNNTSKAMPYSARYSRKNQYDNWPIEDSLRNRTVLYLRESADAGPVAEQDSIQIGNRFFYIKAIQQARLYQKIDIQPIEMMNDVHVGEIQRVRLRIRNPYATAVDLGNGNSRHWLCQLEVGFAPESSNDFVFAPLKLNGQDLHIEGESEITIDAAVPSPKLKGRYRMQFSIRTDPFPGSRNSAYIPINVR